MCQVRSSIASNIDFHPHLGDQRIVVVVSKRDSSVGEGVGDIGENGR